MLILICNENEDIKLYNEEQFEYFEKNSLENILRCVYDRFFKIIVQK